MYPPEVAGFAPDTSGRLQTVPIDICTMYAEGPRPVAYSPPAYDEIVRVIEEAPGSQASPTMGAVDSLVLQIRGITPSRIQGLFRSR